MLIVTQERPIGVVRAYAEFAVLAAVAIARRWKRRRW